MNKKKIGLILSGGGARGAYQVGVLHGICKMIEEQNLENPLIVYGSSAGAISGAHIASNSQHKDFNIEKLVKVWANLDSAKVFKSNPTSLLWQGVKFLTSLTAGKLNKREKTLSLLDHSPLFDLIAQNINTDQIYKNIDDGHLHGFGINLLNYSNGINTSYYYTNTDVKDWKRKFEMNIVQKISSKHIWASSSIPVLFPPVKIGNSYFGDGGFRHHSPLNTAIHMGADKLLVVGVKNAEFIDEDDHEFPSLAYIIGLLMNSLLNDSLDKDIERLVRTNEYVSESNKLRELEIKTFFPTQDIQELVIKYADQLPKFLHHLLRGLGQDKEAGMLISYLLFYPTYMQELIELGKKDFELQKEDMLKFFTT